MKFFFFSMVFLFLEICVFFLESFFVKFFYMVVVKEGFLFVIRGDSFFFF